MDLASRPELRFHTKMDLQILALEPHTTPLGQFGGFRNLRNTKNARVEVSGTIFLPSGHGELNMFDADDSHDSSRPTWGIGRHERQAKRSAACRIRRHSDAHAAPWVCG